jgi:hypothetical protein
MYNIHHQTSNNELSLQRNGVLLEHWVKKDVIDGKPAEFVASTGTAIKKTLYLDPIEKGETNPHADNAI